MLKNKKHNYIFAIGILGVVCILCLVAKGTNLFLSKEFPDAFHAEESYIEDGKGVLQFSEDQMYTYRLDNVTDTLMIVSYQGQYMEDEIKNLVIPSKIDEYVVTCVDECAIGWDENLTSITFPETIEIIRKDSVMNTPNLIEIKCTGENLIEIEEDAFPDFNGIIVTKKNSMLWEYAVENNIDVKEIDNGTKSE